MELKVTKPMILECDNRICVDLDNNWFVDGHTSHDFFRWNVLCDLKE